MFSNIFLILVIVTYAHAACVYGGLGLFQTGEVATFKGCHRFKCTQGGKWEPFPFDHENKDAQPIKGCNMCNTRDDPHFWTFDRTDYDMQRSGCYYVMTQYLVSPTFTPAEIPWDNNIRFGVKSKFRPCAKSPLYPVSCVDETVFKNSMKTRILFNHTSEPTYRLLGPGTSPTAIGANTLSETSVTLVRHPSDPVQHVFLWRRMFGTKPAIMAFGRNLFLIITDHTLDIIAKRTYHNKLGGLCGSYNGNSADDLQTSSGAIAALVPPFARSWKVKKLCKPTMEISEKRKECKDRETLSKICQGILEKQPNLHKRCPRQGIAFKRGCMKDLRAVSCSDEEFEQMNITENDVSIVADFVASINAHCKQ